MKFAVSATARQPSIQRSKVGCLCQGAKHPVCSKVLLEVCGLLTDCGKTVLSQEMVSDSFEEVDESLCR